MGAKVVTLIGLTMKRAEEILSQAGIQVVFAPLVTEGDIIQHAGDADAVIVGPTEPYGAKAIQGMKKCKIISRYGIGINNIDVEEATRQGIPVAYVPDASMHEVSDYAMACLLALSRRLFPLVQAVRAGAWQPASETMQKARGQIFRLNEQVLGLVGMGRIGGLVAQKAKAFGLKVLVYDPYLSAENAKKIGVELVDLDRVLKESDYISLHAPLTPETQKLFGVEAFKKMKPTAYLINAARGGLIDEKALQQAVSEGWIAGAALDVTDPEPPKLDSPLLNVDQILLTGHSSWFSDASTRELQERAAQAVILALEGKWPSTLANPQVRGQENRRIR